MDSVLVTGAAGTVGSVVASLLETAGYKVVASDMRAQSVSQPTRGEVRAADLRSVVDVERMVKGVRHVVHTAAALDASLTEEHIHKVNVEGTRSLYRAARAAGVETFFHMSTATLYGPGQSGPLSEDARILPRGPHGRSKWESEQVLAEESAKGGPAYTVLRAAPIYGRRGRYFASSLLAVAPLMRMASPILPRVSVGAKHTFVHADDVARALVFLLSKRPPSGSVFHVADDDPMSMGDRIAETIFAYGLPSIAFGNWQRVSWLQDVAWMKSEFARRAFDQALARGWELVRLRYGLKSALRVHADREAIALLHEDLVLDTGRLRALGFQVRYRFREGFAQTLRWYQAEGWVPRYV